MGIWLRSKPLANEVIRVEPQAIFKPNSLSRSGHSLLPALPRFIPLRCSYFVSLVCNESDEFLDASAL
jgi:hypothetical protein